MKSRERFFPECPLNNTHCWAHQREVDFSRVGNLAIEWRDEDEADVKIDVEIDWRWNHAETVECLIGFHGGLPPDCCRCLLVTARATVLDLVDAEYPCVDDFLRVYGLLNYALGSNRQCAIEISSPTKPPWLPARKGGVN